MIASKSIMNDLSAYGVARATIAGAPLSDAEVRKTHAFWCACNYLALGMIYLQENPLLRETLKPEHCLRTSTAYCLSPIIAFVAKTTST